MNIVRTETFKKDFQNLPKAVQAKFEAKLRLFLTNRRHPSLRVKKMKGYQNRWEASIDLFSRWTFEIHQDYYLFRRIGPHDNVLGNP